MGVTNWIKLGIIGNHPSCKVADIEFLDAGNAHESVWTWEHMGTWEYRIPQLSSMILNYRQYTSIHGNVQRRKGWLTWIDREILGYLGHPFRDTHMLSSKSLSDCWHCLGDLTLARNEWDTTKDFWRSLLAIHDSLMRSIWSKFIKDKNGCLVRRNGMIIDMDWIIPPFLLYHMIIN